MANYVKYLCFTFLTYFVVHYLAIYFEKLHLVKDTVSLNLYKAAV